MRQWIQNNLPWIAVIASLVSGGAMGAAITAVINHSRNKRQPVLFSFISLSLTDIPDEWKGFKQLAHAGRLWESTLYLRNNGNQDISKFHFGITLHNRKILSLLLHFTPDRHHVVRHSPIEPGRPSQVDLTIEPFNRGELYT